MNTNMTLEQFEKAFVKVEEINPGEWGYHPFHMISVDNEDKVSVHCLIGHKSEDCYAAFQNQIAQRSKNVIMAVDFPAAQDVPHDFILIFQFNAGEEQSQIKMIQYDKDKLIECNYKDYQLIGQIIAQFCSYMLNNFNKHQNHN